MTYIKSLLHKTETFFAQIPLWLHLGLAIFAYLGTRVTNIILDHSYAASLYPVPFYVGQTAFRGEVLKGYYAHMLEAQTLDIYWRTQLIDFGFIAAVFIAGVTVSLCLARLNKPFPFLYKLSLVAALLIPLGAIFDTIENLISFVMLAQPTHFPDWIAFIYSSFAVLKFAAIIPGYCLWAICLIGFLIVKYLFKIKPQWF
jgi:hypothetical protein